MPIQNVTQGAPNYGDMRLIRNTPPVQLNREIVYDGNMATSERMFASRDPVSNFGNETHIGTGVFSRISHETMETSVENIASIMEQDDEFEGSKMGDYSPLGPTGFQQFNDRSFENQQQIAVNAYKYFGNYGAR